jgi:cobalt/nickel transport system permease protein
MFAFFLASLPFVVQDGHETLEVGFVTLSVTGLLRLIALTAKIASMISLMLVLLATTPMPGLFKAARALWMPRLLVLLMLLTYRYVFLLTDEFARLRIALRVRGFRNRADLHSYRTIGQVAGTLLVRSHERSERVGQAMRCRGFDGEFRALDDFRTAWPDPLAFALIVGYAVGLLAWDRLLT